MNKSVDTILVTDCGSTTTKALLFQKTKDGWRQTCRGEAPTTVEEPVADVTVGALNAFVEIEELSARKILQDSKTNPFLENNSSQGIDLYLSTSSAGGGLQMLVSGVVKNITAESATRAALGAGAIVLESFAADDGYEDFERIEKIRHLKPDIFLLTGGVNSGAINQVIEMAETLLSAAPRPRFGNTLRLPVIYAGNQDIADEIQEILAKVADVSQVNNVRPSFQDENLAPAREAIHELFLTHVMSHSPGYDKLIDWASKAILPTPSAVGVMVEAYAKDSQQNVLCVDIGGATTDMFSIFKDADEKQAFNRTVSANLGMSYSVANVLLEAGVDNIARWLPYEILENELKDRLRNKMIRPTSIPQTKEDLWLEQSVCREALRLSLDHHRSLAMGLSGVQQSRGIADIFAQQSKRKELVDMMALDIVIGSGGVLSHAPNRLGSALMMLDGFNLQGLTHITVDSIFMLPHLGVLSTVDSAAANEIFINDCLVSIAHSIVPVFTSSKVKETLAIVKIASKEHKIKKNQIEVVPLGQGKKYQLSIEPVNKHVNLGAGSGEVIEKEITAGEFGLILDGRNRPQTGFSVEKQKEFFKTLNLL